MKDPTKKLKLVCSFNAKFGYPLPGYKTRYIGGETRIISVDPTMLTFLSLRSLITQRFSLTTNDFILKYKLPSLQTGTGRDTDTGNDMDPTLVLLDNDDDLLCMVEEYERVLSCGNNKFSRLWVYIFDGNCDGLRKRKDITTKNLGLIGLVPQVKENLNLGLTGLVPLTKEHVGSNDSLKKSLVSYGYNSGLNKNNVGRKKGRGENICLRKFVLKQQMLLARQRDQNGYADSKLGVNVDSRPDPWTLSTAKIDVNDSSISDGCGRKFDGYGNLGVHVGNYDQPLIDLRPDGWTLSTAKNDVDNSLSNDSSERKSSSYGSLSNNDECFGVNSTLGSNSCQLSVQDGNLIEGKSPEIRPSVECSKGMSGSLIDEQCLNRENGLSSTLHCNALSSGVCSGVLSHFCTRTHQIRSRDVSDQELGLSFDKRNCCVGDLGGKVSDGARSDSVLGVLKNAQAMRFYHHNSSRTRTGLHRLSKLAKMRKLSDFRKENIQKQDNFSAEQSQVYRYGDGHSFIDLNRKHCEVKYEDKYDCETITKCNSDHVNAEISAPYMIQKNVEHYASRDMTYSDNTEVVRSGLIDSCGLSNGITSLSSYNPSSSSSNVANPTLSQLSIEGSGSLGMTQLKYTGTTDEAKQVAETEESSKTQLHSVIDIMTQWDKGLSPQEEIQGDPPVNPDDKVDSAKNKTYSNLIDGIPSDSAAFCTYLATRGLQTIQGSDLEYIKELGSGNYGTVYHGKWKGSDVAIKKIKHRFLNGVAKEENRLIADFWKEAQILSQLHHPNIVAFYGMVTDGPITKLATVTEYMRNGSLKQVLQRKCRTIDQRKRLIIAMDAAFGMEYLHEKRIVHFDLKSHNFLVNMRDPQRPVCKIGDLGLSKIKQRTLVSGGVRGTIPWMAPELLSSSTNLVTEKVDVYSFGIVMWELFTGEEPYANLRSKDIIAAIIQGKLRPEIPSWCEPSWRSLMERCWSSDPKSRPSFPEIAKELRTISASMNIK